MMNPKSKAALGMGQGILMTVIGLLMGLFPAAYLRPLPAWFGWILFVIGVFGFVFYLRRYQRFRSLW